MYVEDSGDVKINCGSKIRYGFNSKFPQVNEFRWTMGES